MLLMLILPGTGDWRRKHLANIHRNTPQSMLFSCCGMSFGVFVKKHHCFASRLLSTCCSSFQILAMAFSADGFVKDPALPSKTRTLFSLGRIRRRNQCLLWPGLHGTRTASCFVRRPFPLRRSLIGLLPNPFSNASHPRVSMFRPLERLAVAISCKYASITKLVR